jgi:hypothetical protein
MYFNATHPATRITDFLQTIWCRKTLLKGGLSMDEALFNGLELRGELLFRVKVDVSNMYMMGQSPWSDTIIAYIKGGEFEGPRLKGKVLPEGGDWPIIGKDPQNTWQLDVRQILQTDDGALIYSYYRGRLTAPPDVAAELADPEKIDQVDPSRYYFRTSPVFETSSEKYAWLNSIVAIGVGRRITNGVAYNVYEIK